MRMCVVGAKDLLRRYLFRKQRWRARAMRKAFIVELLRGEVFLARYE
jgi:hypothetical protein